MKKYIQFYKKFNYFSISCILIFLFLFVFPQLNFMSVKERQTRAKLRSIHCLIEMYERNEGNTILLPLVEGMQKNNMNINESLFFILKSNNVNSYAGYTLSQIEQLKTDKWGEPLHIDYATNIVCSSEGLTELLGICGIVIWSGGPNRLDDRCTGDDIVQGIPHNVIKKDEEVSLRKLREVYVGPQY